MQSIGKAMARRLAQPAFATRYFVGQGLDVTAGSEHLIQFREFLPLMKEIRAWTAIDGDPQHLTGLPDSQFDFVHAGHVLQRMSDPREALRHWFRVLKAGGHLIATVPDEDMHEQGFWPSRNHHDNRWTFTLFKAKSWSPVSINLLEMVQSLGAQADVRRLEVIDSGFRHGLPRFDQTLTPLAECAIELVIRKRPQAEAVAGGRVNPDGQLSPGDLLALTGFTPSGS